MVWSLTGWIGNAGTPLGRLPAFERLLLGIRLSQNSALPSDSLSETAILAIAPRSFWKSTPRRPTEVGLLSDYEHALSYACRRFPFSNIILYGHSLGGAAAVCLAARIRDEGIYHNVKGMVLENPFASIPAMVKALYPQRWLPYHYLGGFAFDKWDAVSAMSRAQVQDDNSLLRRLSQSMLLILSKKDEIVPNEQGLELFEAANSGPSDGSEARRSRVVVMTTALHENAWTERQWRSEVEQYIRSLQGEERQARRFVQFTMPNVRRAIV